MSSFNIILLVILAIVLASIFFFIMWSPLSEINGDEYDLTPEQIVAIQRHNNLFENVLLHNGFEWKTLSVKQLVEVCLTARDAIFEMHGGEHSYQAILQETIVRCRELADWMEDMQHSRFYMNSDMSHLIEKPRAVADQLELINH